MTTTMQTMAMMMTILTMTLSREQSDEAETGDTES
jgi:hypothetical protein